MSALDRFERHVKRTTVNRADAWFVGFTVGAIVTGALITGAQVLSAVLT